MVVSFAALAGRKIELQGDRILHGRNGGFDCSVREDGAAEICV